MTTLVIKVPNEHYKNMLKSFLWENECSLNDCVVDAEAGNTGGSVRNSTDPDADMELVVYK